MVENSATDWILINLKFRGKCIGCGKEITSGRALWSRTAKSIKHLDCSVSNPSQSSNYEETESHKQKWFLFVCCLFVDLQFIICRSLDTIIVKSRAKIRDRTYGHIKIGSELIFSIERHPYAWKNEARMQTIIQTWVFDFANLSLKELSYDAATVGISIRRLMELKSEWKGTSAKLLAELKKVAEELKIDTESNLWPRSSYKLNVILQSLKEYLKENGMTIERQRNLVKINKSDHSTLPIDAYRNVDLI
jgi:hypothetical protein